MKFLLVTCFIILFEFDKCSTNKHSIGTLELGGDLYFYKTILKSENAVPKNYTIIFKYMSGKMAPTLSYFEIDVNVFSAGSLRGTNELKNIDANITIPNGLNVTATISSGVFGLNLMPVVKRWPFTEDETSSKSYTIIYVKNAKHSHKTFASNSIGTRQLGDQLIYFESRNITNVSRFPSRAFEYSGEDSITYVGFSFNSPTAMALLNTTFLSEKEFSSIAYDMNTDHFIANVSIYGYKPSYVPETYVNILGIK